MTAGISACDAITGALVGQRAGGEHAEALSLLATAGDDGRYAARQLFQLLRFKTPAQYDPAPFPAADARRAVELARRLAVRAARMIERRRPWASAWSGRRADPANAFSGHLETSAQSTA